MPEIKKTGAVCLFNGTGARFDGTIFVSMLTKNIGRIAAADIGEISSTLVGKIIYLDNGVIFMAPENALWSDNHCP